MFAYCGNNPAIRVDTYGNCYYTAGGKWAHDNWEYIGGYERKPDPRGNYFKNDVEDLSNVTTTTYEDISKEEAVEFYETISDGDYAAFSNYSSAVIGSAEHPLLSIFLGFFSDIENRTRHGIYDPEGRLLYIEEGYTVVTIEKFYWDMDYFASDMEYFIYDEQKNLVFNDVRGITYMPGF